jgi:putative hydrolase of HD superfamily
MLFSLQRLVSDLSLIDRNHHVLGSERQENDIEHSFTVALLCWYIHGHYDIALDLNKLFKYAFVHDFAERYAGDTNTFASKADRQKKVELEAASVARLTKEFAEFDDMVQALRAYEAKADEEALFVWTVDKMQALILGDLDDWRPYKNINLDFDTFSKKHHELLSSCSSHCREIYDTLLEYCKTTYYDRPQAS